MLMENPPTEILTSHSHFVSGDLILLCTGEYELERTLVRAKQIIDIDELQMNYCREKNIMLWSIPDHAKFFFKWLVEKGYVEKLRHKTIAL